LPPLAGISSFLSIACVMSSAFAPHNVKFSSRKT
jgi:hypothetical protein